MKNPSPSNKSLTKSLSKVELGTPISELKKLFQTRWKPLSPRDEGWVIDNYNLPVSLRFDDKGMLAFISFSSNSPKLVVQQLSPGMSLEQVLEIYPDITPDKQPELEEYGISQYKRSVHETVVLTVRFRNNKLGGVSLEDISAEYPDKNTLIDTSAIIYPDKDGEPSKYFKDANLKLAVLGDLIFQKLIDFGDKQSLLDFVYGTPTDLEDMPFGLLDNVYEYLVSYPIDKDFLSKLQSVSIDFSDDIYSYCFNGWDGESEEFSITSLEGIQECENIVEIYLTHGCNDISLKPLKSLKNLKKIHTDLSTFTDYEVLSDILNLEYIGFLGASLPPDIEEKLTEKNVQIMYRRS